jgi:hypothetical protein
MFTLNYINNKMSLLEYRIINDLSKDCGCHFNQKCNITRHQTYYIMCFCGKCIYCERKEIEMCKSFSRYEEKFTTHKKCEICREGIGSIPFKCAFGLEHRSLIDVIHRLVDFEHLLLAYLKKLNQYPSTGMTYMFNRHKNQFYQWDEPDIVGVEEDSDDDLYIKF